MENSTDNNGWSVNYNDTASIDVETAHPNFDIWDPMMIFSDVGTQHEAPASQSLFDTSIDSIIMTPQNIQSLESSNQELYNLDNDIFSPSHFTPQSLTSLTEDVRMENTNKSPVHLTPQSLTSPTEEARTENTNEEEKELKSRLQEVRRELLTMKGEVQSARSELYTIKSNHAELMRWTMDTNEALKAMMKGLAEHVGANIVGLEESGSWLNLD